VPLHEGDQGLAQELSLQSDAQIWAKGSRKSEFAFLAHRFAADLGSPCERNRRRSPSYVEDYAIAACPVSHVARANGVT